MTFKAVASSDESIALGTDADRNITAAWWGRTVRCYSRDIENIPGPSRRGHAEHIFPIVLISTTASSPGLHRPPATGPFR
jgi:hypothetical protein